MIVTTIRPSDFTYTSGVGLVPGYYRYVKNIDGQYILDIQFTEGSIGTTAGYRDKILSDKSVSFRFLPHEGADKLPMLYKIYGGSIKGLGTDVIPEILEETTLNITGKYVPEVTVQNTSTGEEITSIYTVKLNAAGNYLTMFTDWDGDNSTLTSDNIFILCIGNKDVEDTSGIWLQVGYQVGQNLIKQNPDGSLVFHYYFQDLSNDNIVNAIVQHVVQYENTDGYYKLLHYDSVNYLADRNNSISVYLNTNRTAIGDKPFYIEVYEDEVTKTIEELDINTIEDRVYEAPEGTVYNKVNLTIPKQEYILDLAKPTSGIDRTNIIGKDGTITPITPNGYLISRISGKVRVKDVNLTITANGTTTYESEGSFYNEVTINTNVQSIGDIKVGLSISEVNCDKDTLFYDESNIVFKLNVVVNDNYSVYLSTDNGRTFDEYTGDFAELYFVLGDRTKKIYYKLKNKTDNTYTSASSIEIPVLGYILNAIDVPELKIVKTGNDKITIYVTSIDSLDHHFKCNLNINNKDYTIDDIDNNYVDVKVTSEYLTIESYFYKNINGEIYRGNSSNLVVNTNSLAVIELTKIEYNDPAYVYNKVPTKYYGVYLTLLKLLSDNGETLLNDCASACKSSSHKLTSLWNMFNAACGAYLNDNKKLADVLIKTITSQLNIMYDENFDFLQHRIFIGNYTLENKNNPNEFNTVDLYKLTPTEYDVCSDVELTFTIKQTSDIHYIMLPPELDLKYVSFGDTIKTVLFDSANNINLYKTRSWRMADKDTDGTIYWYYSPAGAFNDIITVVCKHK